MGKSSIFTEKPVGKEASDLVREHFPAGSNGKRGKAAASAPLGSFFANYTESSKTKLWDAVRGIMMERAFRAASGQ